MQGDLHPVVVAYGPWSDVKGALEGKQVHVGSSSAASVVSALQGAVPGLLGSDYVGVVVVRKPNATLERGARVCLSDYLARAFLALECANAELVRRGALGAEELPVVWQRAPRAVVVVDGEGAVRSSYATMSAWNVGDAPDRSGTIKYELVDEPTTPASIAVFRLRASATSRRSRRTDEVGGCVG
jgi:hypothetical protein